MKFYIAILFVSLLTITSLPQKPKDMTEAIERAEKSVEVINQFGALGNKSLPIEYLQRAKAVAVFPGTSKYSIMLSELLLGKGLVSIRSGDEWGVPVFLSLKGTDMNFKFADKKTFDIVVLFLDDKSVELLKKRGVGSTGDYKARIILGPVVKGPGTDKSMVDVQIVYYIFEKGQLADIDLANNFLMGAFGIIHNNDLNKAIFGLKTKELFISPDKGAKAPAEVEKFRTALVETLSKTSLPESKGGAQ